MEEARNDAVPETVLEAFGFAGAVCTRFERGVVNRHWLVSVDERRSVIGRYNQLRTSASIEWEQALVRHAASKGWPVPVPIAAGGGTTLVEDDGYFWAAAQFLEGESTTIETPAMFNICGRLLGRLHQDLSTFEVEGQRPDSGKVWELDALVAPANAGSFNDIVARFGQEFPELAAAIRRQRYRSLRELSRLRYPDLPGWPIHGDFQRWNLLWKEAQLTGVLDFDQSCRDAQVCDIAPLLMPFEPLDFRLVSALLEGYQSVRPLTELERELLPGLVRASLLSWVARLLAGWRMTGVAPGGIARTMTVRFPAFEAAEAGFRTIARTAAS